MLYSVTRHKGTLLMSDEFLLADEDALDFDAVVSNDGTGSIDVLLTDVSDDGGNVAIANVSVVGNEVFAEVNVDAWNGGSSISGDLWAST